MDWAGPDFIVAIIAVSTAGWLLNNWIRAKHGYSLEDEWGGKTDKADSQEAAQLKQENSELRALLGKVDKRMQVLETIVTDRGYDVATQIEALRERSDERHSDPDIDSGVSLNLKSKETI
ncbi:hypothetical protein [Qipengyuania marisflavi]|uniref:hypothetical protein n=1 Tax=Qipengyuania marisflavi TaxID=2486356 RepID=UPI001FE9C47B|nr:hypothetical protein [Qipengyuania marisflavi]